MARVRTIVLLINPPQSICNFINVHNLSWHQQHHSCPFLLCKNWLCRCWGIRIMLWTTQFIIPYKLCVSQWYKIKSSLQLVGLVTNIRNPCLPRWKGWSILPNPPQSHQVQICTKSFFNLYQSAYRKQERERDNNMDTLGLARLLQVRWKILIIDNNVLWKGVNSSHEETVLLPKSSH